MEGIRVVPCNQQKDCILLGYTGKHCAKSVETLRYSIRLLLHYLQFQKLPVLRPGKIGCIRLFLAWKCEVLFRDLTLVRFPTAVLVKGLLAMAR
jgi:hypothetical protein